MTVTTDDWGAPADTGFGQTLPGGPEAVWDQPATEDASSSAFVAAIDPPAEAWDVSLDAAAADRPDDQNPVVLALPARPSAEEVRQALLLLIADSPRPGAVTIDAAAVERLPMPVIQVLLAAIRELRAVGRSLSVRNPSFAFGLAFEALGYAGEREIFTVEYC